MICMKTLYFESYILVAAKIEPLPARIVTRSTPCHIIPLLNSQVDYQK